MKNHLFSWSSIFCLAVILLVDGCSSDNGDSKITRVHVLGIKSKQLVISRVNQLGSDMDEIYRANVDSVNHSMSIDLVSPTVANLEVNGVRTQIFLSPGNDLTIRYDSLNHVRFSGDGAPSNYFLSGNSEILARYTRSNGKYFFQLDEDAFFFRLDSLKTSYNEFEKGFKDTLRIQ